MRNLQRRELLVQLVTTNLGHVVPANIEEHAAEHGSYRFIGWRIAWTQLTVNVKHRGLGIYNIRFFDIKRRVQILRHCQQRDDAI